METTALLRRTCIGLALFGTAACGPSAEVQRQLAELTAVSAEKDSLLLQVTENAKLMSDITAELARVQQAPPAGVGAQEAPPVEVTRENLLAGIQDLTARLEQSETRLAESEKRVEELSRQSGTQRSRIAEFQRTISDLQSTLENQKQTIASLTEQVNSLQEENVRLTTENVALAAEKASLSEAVEEMTERDNTVYYVVGTKDELKERGIITEEGGSRVLFVFGKRGETLVPARDLDVSQFIPVDRREWLRFVLPEPDKRYRIVTRQDLTALGAPADDEGRIRGELHIADPERFWANGKFLILVRS